MHHDFVDSRFSRHSRDAPLIQPAMTCSDKSCFDRGSNSRSASPHHRGGLAGHSEPTSHSFKAVQPHIRHLPAPIRDSSLQNSQRRQAPCLASYSCFGTTSKPARTHVATLQPTVVTTNASFGRRPVTKTDESLQRPTRIARHYRPCLGRAARSSRRRRFYGVTEAAHPGVAYRSAGTSTSQKIALDTIDEFVTIRSWARTSRRRPRGESAVKTARRVHAYRCRITSPRLKPPAWMNKRFRMFAWRRRCVRCIAPRS